MQPTPIRQVGVVEAERLARSGAVLLLDVREADEWDSGHAPDAVHRALGSLTPTAVPQDRPIIAVCRSGHRSGQATQALAATGRDVRNLAGGMQAWAAAGMPVVRTDGGPGTVI